MQFGHRADVIDDVSTAEVRQWLAEGTPLIAVVDPSLLYSITGAAGHFVVVFRWTLRTVWLHDPEIGPRIPVGGKAFERAWNRKGRKVVRVWSQ